MTSAKNQGFTLVELLVVIGILGILASALFPAISNAVMQANMTAVGTRGRDIYVAITGANTEREPLGLGNVWPKTVLENTATTTGDKDIGDIAFTTSSEYFYKLNDGEKVGKQEWSPYVAGFDYSKLAGAGVAAKSGQGELQPANNMWCIAANVRDEMEDIIPILVTRNLDCQTLYSDLTDGSVADKITFSTDAIRKTPFSNKGFVMIRKGGAIFKARERYATVKVVYQNQSFLTTVSGSSAAGLVYLTPSGKETPKKN
jgi:prepilin-type N-terminal cleavage/methylation domain-containing protein